MNRQMPLLFLFVALVLPGRAETESSPAEAVRAVVHEIIAADNARDLDRAMSCYTDDLVNLPPTGGAIRGKAEQRARYASLFAQNQVELETSIEELHADADYAWVRGVNSGKIRPLDGSAARIVRDNYLMILRREQNGRWRIHRLMWTPEKPAGK
jgi:uncharacterized protein (TIGR02246 family)